MSIGFESVSLGEVVELRNGYAFKSKQFSDDPSDIPLVKGSNLGHREIRWSEGPWWPRGDWEEFEHFHIGTGDVVVAMDRPIVGGQLKYAWISEWEPGALLVQRVCRLRGTDRLDQDYLRYVIGSPAFTAHVERITTGVNVPHISGGDIQRFEFELPSVAVQRRIADILSAYDDLIENNNRRMALLEESIHLLYREWFVYLRFPGHERVEVVDGVPEGWERRAVKDAFSYLGGGTPSRKRPELWSAGTVDWYSPTDLTRSGSLFMEGSKEQINDLGLAQSSAKLFPAWSVMFTSRATIGAVAINTGPATTNQGFINCLPNDRVPLYFLYCWLRANTEEFIARATGSTFKELSKSKFGVIPILLPPERMGGEFNELVRPLAEQALALQRQNTKLREARDLLLPRLMDGRIPV